MNAIQKFFDSLRRKSADVGYACDACGGEVFEYPFRRLCADCERSLSKNEQKSCKKCGRKTVTEGVCLNCKRELPKFDLGISPLVYEGQAASLVNRMKKGETRLAWYLGEEMAESLIKVLFPDGNGLNGENPYRISEEEPLLLVPVPLTVEREKERGYNQAERLAEGIERRLCALGVPVETGVEVLQKLREGEQQKQMGYQARKENVRGAYHVHQRMKCKERTVVLIDDILTTGATGNECAERLFGAGARTVLFLTASSLAEQK